MSFRTSSAAYFLIFIPVIFILSACSSDAPVPAESTRVSITSGELRGKEHLVDTFAWFGIPYAAPPVGDLRWRAPRPALSWEGTFDAFEYGSLCFQPPNGSSGDIAPRTERMMGSEDCLSLNVYAPKNALNADEPLPVMFWIHGGANLTGSSQTEEGAYLASSQNVVVVSANYRLGLLGWFRHAALRATAENEADASGNFAALDLIAALQWVQSNIKNFGGDPSRVTIFGESAGGRNTWTLVQSPLAKGLFHGAIVESGSLRLTDPLKSEAYDRTEIDYPVYKNNSGELVAKLLTDASLRSELDTAKKLRNVSVDDLYVAAEEPGSEGDVGFISRPRVFLDGYVLIDSPLELFKDPSRYNAVPIITGTNRDELKMFMMFGDKWVDKRLGFLPEAKNTEQYNRAGAYDADYWRLTSVDLPTEIITRHGGAPVYNYRFDYDDLIEWPVDLPNLMGAAHGLDMLFVFGTNDKFPANWIMRNKEARVELSDTMMNYWGQFAHTGDPGRGSDESAPRWHSWSEEGDHLILLDTNADGGVRMIEDRMTIDRLKQRLLDDDFLDQEQKCEMYRKTFLTSFSANFGFDMDEYRQFGGASCPLIYSVDERTI